MVDYSINEIRKWPKVELHLHFDLCLSFPAIKQLVPGIDEESYNRNFVLPEKISGLTEFLERSTRLVALLQDETALQLAVADLFRQLAAENVIYAEIRFAPLLHTQKELTPEAVIRCIYNACKEESEKTNVSFALILCTLRHFDREKSMQSVSLAQEFFNSGINGFDIASEERMPLSPHVDAFDLAHVSGIPCTAHCGESGGPESISEVLHLLKPKRIGHGTRCVEDPHLVSYLITHQIHLEMCPTCNVQLDVVPDFTRHPIDQLYRAGANVGINTDNRTMTGINLSEEYVKIRQTFGWEIGDFYRVNSLSLNSAFVSEEEKLRLGAILDAGYRNVGWDGI
jgi:adenosine deaminase